MFELGFGEIILIAVVALVVLGPERLPGVARSAGLWVGRIQNFIANVKTELSQQSGVSEFREARDSIEQAARQFRQEMHGNVADLHQDVQHLQQEVVQSLPSSLPSEPDAEQKTAALGEWSWETPSSAGTASYAVNRHHGAPLHQVSLRRQALQRKRAVRPPHHSTPQLRVRRRP